MYSISVLYKHFSNLVMCNFEGW